jgi:AcrR family transcriptional regulator
VGKGTLFRRFGDRSGLAAALLGEREAVLQEAMIYGTPPLGPGAPPGERLLAFVGSYADFLEENLNLLHLSETSTAGARYRVGSYLLWHRHVGMLLRQARPDLDAEHLAHALLAPLGAEHYRAMRKDTEPGRLRATAESLARLVLTGETR